jgi:2-polyprenyl-6-methoxyphenol hydroxylase-like FAD-dependent oxidoreductase
MEAGEEYIATSYIAPGDRFVLTRRYNPQRIQVYLIGKSVTKRLGGVHKWDVSEEKKAFAEVFRGAGWQVEGILESLMEADNFYCETQGLVKLNLWYQGRVVLLGDAAYSHSAITDMGTSSAIVGAYILAGEIGVHCPGDGADDSHTTAFRAYDNKFRPFMDQMQTGVGNSSIFDNIPWSPLTISVLYWVLWLASCLRLDLLSGLLGDQPVKGWDLPEYGILMDDAKADGGL